MRLGGHERQLFGVGLAVVLGLCLYRYVGPIWDIDFWWHIASGRYILQHHVIPEGDVFGVYPQTTGLEARVVAAYSWLGQVLLAVVYERLGPVGIITLRAGVLALCLVFLVARARRLGAGLVPTLTVAALAGVTAAGFTGERPNLLSFLMASAVFALADLLAGPRPKSWPALALPAVVVLWANLHGGVALGGALLFLLTAAVGAEWILHRRAPRGTERRRLLAFLAGAAASLASPAGLDVYRAALRLEGTLLQQRTSEYASPFLVFSTLEATSAAYWLLVALAVSGLARLDWRARPDLPAGLLALTVLGLNTARYVPFFLYCAGPPIALGLSRWFERSPVRARCGLRAAALALAALLLGANLHAGELQRFGVDPRFPTAAVAFLKQRGLRGRLFNHLDWGGYLLWHTELRPFIDGRTLLAARTNVLAYYTHVLWATPIGLRILDDLRFELVLIPHRQPRTGEPYRLNAVLEHSPGWRVLYRDELAQIFRRAPR